MSRRAPNEYDYRRYTFDVPSYVATRIKDYAAKFQTSELQFIRYAVAEKLGYHEQRSKNMGDLVIGSYREGLTQSTLSYLEQLESKEKSGFRLSPYEEALLELARVAEGYDEFAEFADEPLVEIHGPGSDKTLVYSQGGVTHVHIPTAVDRNVLEAKEEAERQDYKARKPKGK